MKLGILLIAIASALSPNVAATSLEQATDWYRNDYGAQWLSRNNFQAEAIPKYYRHGFTVHLREGGIVEGENSASYWQSFIDSFPNLKGSSIEALKVSELSQYTVLIFAKWKNTNFDGSVFMTCDGYIAAKSSEGEWKFTNYLVVECGDLKSEWLESDT
jgi:hypothetical protein